MKRYIIFGIDFTPRRLYRDLIEVLKQEIEDKNNSIDALKGLLDNEKKYSARYLNERNDYLEKYHKLLDDTPVRDKNGKFAKRKK